MEALSRIDPSLYYRSARLQSLVRETATALHGDPRLVDLVIRFDLPDQLESLLVIVQGSFEEGVRDQALSYLFLKHKDSETLATLAEQPRLRALLGRNGSEPALDLLIPSLRDKGIHSDERTYLIKLLCSKRSTALSLLKKLQQDPKPADAEIIQLAIIALAQSPWNDLRERFKALSPDHPTTTENEKFDIKSLVNSKGNTAAGRRVFRAPEFSCVNCHVAEGVGKDIGPGLSEIGKKLGKDALYDAILNPSSGISFDYEGWNITLNSGDELTGIVLSKTETHWTLKNLLGQIEEIPLSEVFEKQKMSTSLMPNGLGLLLGKEKLIDLVSYLSTLGK